MEKAGIIDIHAHILPGIDDGARDWQETAALLKAAWEQGIRHIIATPHFSRGTDVNRLRELKKRTAELACREGLDLQISLGQELRYFEELVRYLDQGKALTLAESRYILVEFKPSDGYPTLKRAVHDLVQAGYIPILAHTERYFSLREKGRTEELIERGACLQINGESLLGGLFDKTAAWCFREIRQGRIHFVASDMHRPDTRPPQLKEAFYKLKKKQLCPDPAALFEKNQRYILENRVL